MAAETAGEQRKTPFTDYAVLGDDVVIANDKVAAQYTSLLDKESVSISYSKSIISHDGALEFAKKFWVKGLQVDLSPVSQQSKLCCRSTIGLCQLGAKYNLDMNILQLVVQAIEFVHA